VGQFAFCKRLLNENDIEGVDTERNTLKNTDLSKGSQSHS
jgi:hypothetical protein